MAWYGYWWRVGLVKDTLPWLCSSGKAKKTVKAARAAPLIRIPRNAKIRFARAHPPTRGFSALFLLLLPVLLVVSSLSVPSTKRARNFVRKRQSGELSSLAVACACMEIMEMMMTMMGS